MQRTFEKWYPLVFGFSIAFCCHLLLHSHSPSSSLKDVFSAATTLSSIAIGFLATAESILFSISQTSIIKQLKITGTYKRLINYFMDAINWSFLLAIFSLIGTFIDFKTWQLWNSTLFDLWLLAFAAAGLSSYRVIHVFASILRSSA